MVLSNLTCACVLSSVQRLSSTPKCQQLESLCFTLWRLVFVPHSCRSGWKTTGWLPVHYLSLEAFTSSGYGHQGRLLSLPPHSFNHSSTQTGLTMAADYWLGETGLRHVARWVICFIFCSLRKIPSAITSPFSTQLQETLLKNIVRHIILFQRDPRSPATLDLFWRNLLLPLRY